MRIKQKHTKMHLLTLITLIIPKKMTPGIQVPPTPQIVANMLCILLDYNIIIFIVMFLEQRVIELR